MATAPAHDIEKWDTTFVRIGGLGGFMLCGIYLFFTFVLLEPPPGGALALEDPKTYISDQAGSMAIVNGLRHLVFFCTMFWGAGLYTFTRRSAAVATDSWGVLGLVGTAVAVSVTVIANGIETAIYVNYGGVSEQREVFLLLWIIFYILFAVPQVGTAAMALGFSLAGWRSGAFPKWLVALGLILAAATLLTCIGIVSVMNGGWAAKVQLVGLLLTVAWVLGTSVLMVRRAAA